MLGRPAFHRELFSADDIQQRAPESFTLLMIAAAHYIIGTALQGRRLPAIAEPNISKAHSGKAEIPEWASENWHFYYVTSPHHFER